MSDDQLVWLRRRPDRCERIDAVVLLSFEERQRSRLRVRLDDGREAGILLQRGDALNHGDLLGSDDGQTVQVRAAPESLSVAVSDDWLLLARACYHLGNRHVALQIAPGRLSWRRDHVLDAMARGLGLEVSTEHAAFEPEPGAYAGRAHAGPHGHGH
jgi:urease accessory protein